MSDAGTAPHFPVFLDLRDRLCVVVGGGGPARRKARALAACGADVVVIESRVSDELLLLEDEGIASVEQRGYVRGDLESAFLVVSSSGSEEVDRAVHAEARERGCLVNVSDAPELCDFLMPSTVRRGALQVAISTGGQAPAAAKQLKKRLEGELGEEWADYVALLAEVRSLAASRTADAAERRRILGRAAGPALLERFRTGDRPSAEDVYERAAGGSAAGSGQPPAMDGGDVT